MKHISGLVVSIFCFFSVFAQKNIPSFGKIDKADLEMKDCDFDPGAVAVKLLDIGNMFYDRGTAGITLFKTVYEKRVRIKILKDKGLSYANVEVPFYSHNNDETISKIDACTFNLDESGKIKVTDVSKSSIYIKKINKQASRLIIAFPEAKVGSVVEYRYRLERETYSQIKDWYFQDEIPTCYSEYEIKVPEIFVFTIQRSVVDKIEEKEKLFDDMINVGNDVYQLKTVKQNFIMRNLIGIKDEPYMAAAKDYQQRIEFQLSKVDYGNGNVENLRTSWSDVVKALMKDEDFGQQLTKSIKDIDPLVKEALLISDQDARIKFLFNSIRSKMNCADDEAIYTDEGVSSTWQKKSGNIADINFLLINVLKKAGVDAYPILLSTRENGLVNGSYPFLNQFNTVMAYVPLGNGFYVLDATDKLSNYKLTPERIVNTRAFIVEGASGRVFDVIDNVHNYEMLVAVKGTIDDKGVMSGECSINSKDYARKIRVERYTKSADNFKQEFFIKPYPSVNIQDITVKNSDVDSLPLSQKINFTIALNNSGEYSYFTTNLFAEFDKNPFIEDQRNTDIDFGCQQDYAVYGNFTIPAGYVYETLPQNISMSMRDRSILFTRVMESKDQVLSMQVTIKFKRAFYLASNYADFQEFYKKIIASLNEQVVIKKKS